MLAHIDVYIYIVNPRIRSSFLASSVYITYIYIRLTKITNCNFTCCLYTYGHLCSFNDIDPLTSCFNESYCFGGFNPHHPTIAGTWDLTLSQTSTRNSTYDAMAQMADDKRRTMAHPMWRVELVSLIHLQLKWYCQAPQYPFIFG